jgi:hypothetical protein
MANLDALAAENGVAGSHPDFDPGLQTSVGGPRG